MNRLLATLTAGLSMLSVVWLALIGATLPQVAQAEDQPHASYGSPQPNVSITPRVRPGKEIGGSEGDREATIRVDTTLVLIPVGVADPLDAL